MNLFSNPSWISKFEYSYNNVDEVPEIVFKEINERLENIIKPNPLLTILIAAYNEEINILRCIGSLSATHTKYPLEIIVVNNNSGDRTQETLEKLKIKNLFQAIQGPGPARQMGQENASGKYILLADADCIYPPDWVDKMMEKLLEKDVVCVYGRYSFISDPESPRWQLSVLEFMKDCIAEVRHFKRPYLNAYGISMGYLKEAGLKAGFIMHNTRGEDGRICFDMMQYGIIEQVKSKNARAWTGTRTLRKEGSIVQALGNRIKKEISKITSYLKPHPPHDTKTSQN